MNLDEIRKIIEIDGGKFIILEKGKPVLVILGFEEYKKNLLTRETNKTVAKPITTGNAAVDTGQEENFTEKTPKESAEDLTVDDLPL